MFQSIRLKDTSANGRQPGRISLPAQQRGAVLAISLIFLLVITVLALSNMSSTGLEEKMTANLQASNTVFNGAETSIREHINDMTALSNSYANSPNPYSLPTQTDVDTGLTRTLDVLFNGALVPTSKGKASTMVVGKHGITMYHYELQAEANLDSMNATTTHTQGVYTEGTSFGLARRSQSGGMSRNN